MPQSDTPSSWYVRLKVKLTPERHEISYYKERLFVLAAASLIVAIVWFGGLCLAIWKWDILPGIKLMESFIYEGAILLLIVVCALIGSRDNEFEVAGWVPYRPSSYRSLFFLIAATLGFVSLLTLPIFRTGGAINSPFSSTIVAMCGLAVLVSSSWYIRSAIVTACMVAYISCMFLSPEVQIKNVTGHRILHIVSVFMSLAITLLLSWKSKFLIFKNGEKSDVGSAKTANNSPPAE